MIKKTTLNPEIWWIPYNSKAKENISQQMEMLIVDIWFSKMFKTAHIKRKYKYLGGF